MWTACAKSPVMPVRGGHKQVAEAVAFEFSVREAVLKEAGEQVLILGQARPCSCVCRREEGY